MGEKSTTCKLLAGIVRELVMILKVTFFSLLYVVCTSRRRLSFLSETGLCWFCLAGRISSLEEEARQQRQALSKAETEKRQLQEKHNDLEKVNQKTTKDYYRWRLFDLLWTIFYIGL